MTYGPTDIDRLIDELMIACRERDLRLIVAVGSHYGTHIVSDLGSDDLRRQSFIRVVDEYGGMLIDGELTDIENTCKYDTKQTNLRNPYWYN